MAGAAKGNRWQCNGVQIRGKSIIIPLYGTADPVDGTTGATVAAPGSLYINTTTGQLFRAMGVGTKASPVWRAVGPQETDLTIAAADITGTGAGQFGHANGYPIVAAPGAGFALVLIAMALYYKFTVAAYTGGGNITVNWGAGGAALTGLVSAANSVGAAADKQLAFYPLTTAAVALVGNASLNLVAAAAFTQPGTAAGVIKLKVWTQLVALS